MTLVKEFQCYANENFKREIDIYEHLLIPACIYVSTCSGCNVDYVFKIIPVYRIESSCSKMVLYWPFFWSRDSNLPI